MAKEKLKGTKVTDLSGETVLTRWVDGVGNVTVSYASAPSYSTSISTKPERNEHPFVPKVIYVDPVDKVMVVHWRDGEETKVICDKVDNFDIEAGYKAALTIKAFGNSKTQFKKRWWKSIANKIVYTKEVPEKKGIKNLFKKK